MQNLMQVWHPQRSKFTAPSALQQQDWETLI